MTSIFFKYILTQNIYFLKL